VRAIRVIHVSAAIAAKGDHMTIEETGTAQATATGKPKANRKRRVARKRAHVAPNQPKSAPMAKALKKAPKGPKKAGSARDGSKAAKVLDLLQRPEGASMRELLKSTVLSENLTRGPFHAAFRNTTNSVLVTAIR
jgi:hypothetical protein